MCLTFRSYNLPGLEIEQAGKGWIRDRIKLADGVNKLQMLYITPT